MLNNIHSLVDFRTHFQRMQYVCYMLCSSSISLAKLPMQEFDELKVINDSRVNAGAVDVEIKNALCERFKITNS